MMMIPRRNNFSLWDEMFKDPFFSTEAETKLMKTDVRENENSYILNIDVPGYDKKNIKLSIEGGYLTVEASVDNSDEEKDSKGKYVRRERYYGHCTRSFYVGEDVKPEDIKASFKNGMLELTIPKKDSKEQINETKYIPIDGE